MRRRLASREKGGVEIDFPKSDREAEQKVISAMDKIDPRWAESS